MRTRCSVQLLVLVLPTTVGLVLFAGCGGIGDLKLGTSRPQPKANWRSAPGFVAESLTRIAIIVEDKSRASRNGDALLRSVEDEFIGMLLEKGYQVPTRSDVKKVLQEIMFEQSGLTEKGAAQLGKMLKASAVLIVTINSQTVSSRATGLTINGVPQMRHRVVCNMSARLVSVEKAEILGISSFSLTVMIPSRDDTSPAVLSVAKAIAESVPGRVSK